MNHSVKILFPCFHHLLFLLCLVELPHAFGVLMYTKQSAKTKAANKKSKLILNWLNIIWISKFKHHFYSVRGSFLFFDCVFSFSCPVVMVRFWIWMVQPLSIGEFSMTVNGERGSAGTLMLTMMFIWSAFSGIQFWKMQPKLHRLVSWFCENGHKHHKLPPSLALGIRCSENLRCEDWA